ncbi:MAG: hypothetical protein WC509_03340 [Candidatus Izemoplasmatales bacterium]
MARDVRIVSVLELQEIERRIQQRDYLPEWQGMNKSVVTRVIQVHQNIGENDKFQLLKEYSIEIHIVPNTDIRYVASL